MKHDQFDGFTIYLVYPIFLLNSGGVVTVRLDPHEQFHTILLIFSILFNLYNLFVATSVYVGDIFSKVIM